MCLPESEEPNQTQQLYKARSNSIGPSVSPDLLLIQSLQYHPLTLHWGGATAQLKVSTFLWQATRTDKAWGPYTARTPWFKTPFFGGRLKDERLFLKSGCGSPSVGLYGKEQAGFLATAIWRTDEFMWANILAWEFSESTTE